MHSKRRASMTGRECRRGQNF
uniref:Uncharacterized protein n=1 Tax=Anguilla anguilla TaxID=7936 RepID=A0A0E9UJT6_ANGAN